jgi:hypothetical protein
LIISAVGSFSLDNQSDMGDPTQSQVAVHASRVQRVLEEALDRYVGHAEGERMEGLIQTLRSEVQALPAQARAEVLAALGALYPEPVAVHRSDVDGEAHRQLEQEVERLRQDLAAAQARSAAAPPVEVRSGGVGADDLAKALVGPMRRTGGANAEGSQERALAIVQALSEFVVNVARGYLSVGLDPDKTMAGLFNAVMADEMDGKRPVGSVKKLLDQMRVQIGQQVLAFRKACDAGARELLRQLDPEAIAAETGASRFFSHQKYWEALQVRYAELQRADDLFDVYFGVAFEREMRGRVKQGRPGNGD